MITVDQIHVFDVVAKETRWFKVMELSRAVRIPLRAANACAHELTQRGVFEQAAAELEEEERGEIQIAGEVSEVPPYRYRLLPTAARAPFDAAVRAHNAQHARKPTPDDIWDAIANIENGKWVDPAGNPHCWACVLFDPDGRHTSDGYAYAPEMAMAMAWLHWQAPDALAHDSVDVDTIEFEVEEGWRFELTPPEVPITSEPDAAAA